MMQNKKRRKRTNLFSSVTSIDSPFGRRANVRSTPNESMWCVNDLQSTDGSFVRTHSSDRASSSSTPRRSLTLMSDRRRRLTGPSPSLDSRRRLRELLFVGVFAPVVAEEVNGELSTAG